MQTLDFLGWILYCGVALFAISGLVNIWQAARGGGTITSMGLFQWAFSVLCVIVFGIIEIHKLHIAWVGPVGYILSFTSLGIRMGQFIGSATAKTFNSIPTLFIGICALIGFVISGLLGLALGIVAGFIIAFLIGTISWLFSRGVLPKEKRKQTAVDFASKHQALLSAAYPEISEGGYLNKVEQLLEEIVKRSIKNNSSLIPSDFESLSLERLGVAGEQVARGKNNHHEAEVISALIEFLKNHDLWLAQN